MNVLFCYCSENKNDNKKQKLIFSLGGRQGAIPGLDEVEKDWDEGGEDEAVKAAILVAEGMNQLQAGRLPAQPRRLQRRCPGPRSARPCRGKCCASKDDIEEEVEEKGGEQRQPE